MADFTHTEKRIFSGTSYLNAARSRLFSDLISEGITKYGAHYGGSRRSNICPDIYDETEQFLRKYFEVEDALTVSSGSSAGSFISDYLKVFDRVFYRFDLHPAISFNGIAKATSFYDIDELMPKLDGEGRKIALLFNSFDPVKLQHFVLKDLANIPSNKHFTIIVDDSHGIGIMGENGRSILTDAYTLPANVDLLLVASLGKSYSIPAGVIMGKREVLDIIRDNPKWGGASPTSPAYLFAFLKMQDYYRQQRLKLKSNLDLFLDTIEDKRQIAFLSGFPVFVLKSTPRFEYLKKNGFIISSFPYPAPGDEIVERLVINSMERPEEIRALANLLNEFN